MVLLIDGIGTLGREAIVIGHGREHPLGDGWVGTLTIKLDLVTFRTIEELLETRCYTKWIGALERIRPKPLQSHTRCTCLRMFRPHRP